MLEKVTKVTKEEGCGLAVCDTIEPNWGPEQVKKIENQFMRFLWEEG